MFQVLININIAWRVEKRKRAFFIKIYIQWSFFTQNSKMIRTFFCRLKLNVVDNFPTILMFTIFTYKYMFFVMSNVSVFVLFTDLSFVNSLRDMEVKIPTAVRWLLVQLSIKCTIKEYLYVLSLLGVESRQHYSVFITWKETHCIQLNGTRERGNFIVIHQRKHRPWKYFQLLASTLR